MKSYVERRRPKSKAAIRLAEMRRETPYGIWTCADGREVLFDRDYQPIWSRYPGQPAERANPDEWINWVDQRWFYFDGNKPWATGDASSRRAAIETQKRCTKALQDFLNGAPVTGMREAGGGRASFRGRPVNA
jgi:hypothetical protein